MISLLSVLLCAAPTASPQTTKEAELTAVLEAERTRLHVPGLAAVVVDGDQVLLLRGFGLRDVEHKLAVTPDTLFPIGSATKSFTAVAAAIAQDKGQLTLDDPPRKYLPWFHLVDPEADALVTIRDMLSHRVGLRANADLAAEPGVLSRREYVRAAISAKPALRFGESFQYSNAMITAVGELLGEVHHASWEEVIDRELLVPIGMSASTTSVLDMSKVPDHCVGYVNGQATPPPRTLQTLAPAGAIGSTARDLSRWLRFLIDDGVIGGKRVASHEALREVERPQMLVPLPHGPVAYGLGWALYDWNGHRVVEHNGGSEGISALVSFMPEKRVGFALLLNTSPTELTTIGEAGKRLWPIILGEKGELTAPPLVPNLDALLARMISAAGGERNLRSHRTLEQVLHKRYLQQGIESDVRVRREAPNRFVTDEVMRAVGKQIGTVREYFDGTHGGQETTFGQDAVYSGSELDRIRRDADFRGLVDLKTLFPTLKLTGTAKVGDDDAYLLELEPKLTLAVSARTFQVIQKKSGGTTETYSDFRHVGDWVLPFHTRIEDGFGTTEVDAKQVTFDQPQPAAVFAPHRK